MRNSRIWGKEWENDMRKISPFSTIFSNFFWAQNLLLYYNCSYLVFLALRNFWRNICVVMLIIVMISQKKLTTVVRIIVLCLRFNFSFQHGEMICCYANLYDFCLLFGDLITSNLGNHHILEIQNTKLYTSVWD